MKWNHVIYSEGDCRVWDVRFSETGRKEATLFLHFSMFSMDLTHGRRVQLWREQIQSMWTSYRSQDRRVIAESGDPAVHGGFRGSLTDVIIKLWVCVGGRGDIVVCRCWRANTIQQLSAEIRLMCRQHKQHRWISEQQRLFFCRGCAQSDLRLSNHMHLYAMENCLFGCKFLHRTCSKDAT